MPYSTKSELPDAVKSLPSHAQSVWRAAFNSAHEQGMSEDRCFKIAWAAVEKAGYKKSGGKWMKTGEATYVNTIQGQIRALLPSNDRDGWIRDLCMEASDMHVIVDVEGKTCKYPFTMADGIVKLGQRTEVRQAVEYKPVKIGEACSLVEAEFVTEERVVKNCILVQPGVSKNRNCYSPSVLKRDAAKVFEGVHAFSGHIGLSSEKYSRTDPRNLMGVMKGIRVEESGTVRGELHYFSDFDSQIAKAKEAKDKGLTDLLGMSIWADGTGRLAKQDGKVVRTIESLVRSDDTSVDFVVGPSAGGRIFESEGDEYMDGLEKLSLDELKSARPDLIQAMLGGSQVVENKLDDKVVETVIDNRLKEFQRVYESNLALDTALRTANLPPHYEARVRSSFVGKVYEAAVLQSEIDFYKAEAAKLAEASKVTNGTKVVTVGLERRDRWQLAMDQLFGVCGDTKGVRPFKGIQEAYTLMTGDEDYSGHIKIGEAFDSASLPYILQDSMNKSMLAGYAEKDWGWRNLCSIGSVKDFRTNHATRAGYFGDIPDVDPEVADYDEISPYGDEEVTYALAQKGGVVTLTRKAIINDDVGIYRDLTRKLGRAANRTRAKLVFVTMMEGNTVLTTDSVAFFAAAHGNLGASALSQAAIEATIILMEAFTELTSGEKIGLSMQAGNCWLVVPSALQFTAIKINQKAPIEADPNPIHQWFGADNSRILVSPLFTDATDWYLAFDRSEIDWIRMFFLGNKEEPEFFLADNPIVDQMFIADKLRYKIRDEFTAAWLDKYGCYKHAV